MRVEEIMITKVESVSEDAMVYDAIEKMVDKRLRSLLVRPRKEGDAPGIITVRDVVFKVLSKNLDPTRVRVETIASKPAVCVNRAMGLDHAINLMQNFNIARLFVCDGMEVVGVVSLMDVMGAALIERARGDRVV